MSIMQIYNDLNTNGKIKLLIAFMSLFMIIVGYTGYHFNNENKKNIEELYDKRATAMSELNLARATANGVKADVIEYILTTSPERKKELLDDIQMRKERNNKIFARYKNLGLNESEQEQLDIMTENLEKWRAVQKIVVEKVNNNDKDGAYAYFLANKSIPEKLQQTLRDISDSNNKIAKKIEENTDKAIEFANTFIIATIILAIILSIGFGTYIANDIQKLLNRLVRKLGEIAKGNLKVDKFGHISNSDLGKLCDSFDLMVVNLSNLVSIVVQSAKEISSSTEDMALSADQTAQGSQQVATGTSQLAEGAQEISHNVEKGVETIDKMNKFIQSISQESLVVAKLGNDTQINANEGKKQVYNAIEKIERIKISTQDTTTSINKLGKLSSEIETIVDLIKGIAAQTNLLALNAAIEAARAGEHGKGFAVVADEVKKLAKQSSEATDKINGMIKEIQAGTNNAVQVMKAGAKEVEEGVTVVNETGQTFESIIEQVTMANRKIQDITKEIENVANNSENVVRMIENISSVTEETAASAEEISSITEEQTASMQEVSASAQTLARIAEDLNHEVSVFKV